MPAKTISSRQNPLVARYRAVARGETPGVLLLDGVHLVSEAVAAGVSIRHVAVKTDALKITEIGSLVDTLTRSKADIVAVSAPVMDALSPVRSSSTIVALADRPDVPEDALHRERALIVIAIDVQDPGNVGAIVRVAEAGGATGVITAGVSANPFGWKALRGSMGSALRLPVIVRPDANLAVADARARGCRIVATAPRTGRSPVEVGLSGPVAILIGGEGPGLPPAMIEGADEQVTIPMRPPVESLNAAVTAALIVYEALRQRAARQA